MLRVVWSSGQSLRRFTQTAQRNCEAKYSNSDLAIAICNLGIHRRGFDAQALRTMPVYLLSVDKFFAAIIGAGCSQVLLQVRSGDEYFP